MTRSRYWPVFSLVVCAAGVAASADAQVLLVEAGRASSFAARAGESARVLRAQWHPELLGVDVDVVHDSGAYGAAHPAVRRIFFGFDLEPIPQ